MAEQESLHLIAAAIVQKVRLFFGLDAFGDSIEVKTLRHGDHSRND